MRWRSQNSPLPGDRDFVGDFHLVHPLQFIRKLTKHVPLTILLASLIANVARNSQVDDDTILDPVARRPETPQNEETTSFVDSPRNSLEMLR